MSQIIGDFLIIFLVSGTELNGSLALGNPLSATFEGGELPGPPLGMDVDVIDPVVRLIVFRFFL
jgi:hypothetical protein